MIDPRKCVERILLNSPSELAVPLFDLMTWMADQDNLKDNSEYLDALNVAYLKLDYTQEQRDAYAKERALRAELPSVDSVATH